MGMRETGTQGKQEASKADAGRRCLLILIDLVCLQQDRFVESRISAGEWNE